VDPSALIFVALAVAWAVYLIPKALEHHDESVRTRTVERFSKGMRVLARRTSSDGSTSELVTPERPSVPASAQTAPAPAPAPRVHREAAARAARRRRNVLGVILLALVVVAVLAGVGVVGWVWTAVPGGLLVAWLVACRLMVKRERRVPVPRPVAEPQPEVARVREIEVVDPVTGEIAVIEVPVAAPAPAAAEEAAATAVAAEPPAEDGMWSPMAVPLPTYVSKPPARRSVRTIDLDATGVWSSGRNDADSAIAREAEEAEQVARQQAETRRAAGS